MRKLFLKQKYLNYIIEGKKLLEGRVGYDNIRRFRVGDYVYLNGRYKAQITGIQIYSTFEESLLYIIILAVMTGIDKYP